MTALLLKITAYAFFGNIVLPVAAAVSVVLCIFTVRKLARVQKHLNNSMILVPLYKSRLPLFICATVLFAAAIAFIAIAVIGGEIITYLSLALIAVAGFFMVAALMFMKFAVVDGGILVPYAFIEWQNLADYEINSEKYEVFFTANYSGKTGLSTTTVPMKFNVADSHKLEILLARSKAGFNEEIR